jgi:hypothetical protein
MEITLPESFIELGEIKFKEPVKVEVFIDDIDKIYITWDCGMDGITIDPTTNWCGINKLETTEEKVIRACQYDLAHAFFHYEGDPNYTHYHWALRAIYNPKIEATEIEEIEEID